MTTETFPTCTILSAQTLSDIMVTGIENSSWAGEIRKLKGQNRINPFYACKEFWRNPFEIEYQIRDEVRVADINDLGEALRIAALEHPDIVTSFDKGTFTARQADRFVQLFFRKEAPRG
jgi:hypothetical protein